MTISQNSTFAREKKYRARLTNSDIYVLGFDGSKGRQKGIADSTALVGIRLEDAGLFEIKTWESDGPGWEPPRPEIVALVDSLFESDLVVGGRFDPAGWDDEIAQWTNQYRDRLFYPHLAIAGKWSTDAWDRFEDAIEAQKIKVDFDVFPELRAHLLSARNRGSTVQKAHRGPEAAKIDRAAAAAYAWRAYVDAIEHRPDPPPARSGRVW